MKHSRLQPSVAGVALLLAASAGLAGPFTAGNLVILRVGDGVTPLSNAATADFLDEITTAGVAVQSIAVPTTVASSGNRALTNSGTATSEGQMRLSADGRFLTFGGYNAAPGTAAVVSTASATVARVVAVVNAAGVIDTTTAMDAYSGNNIRSAVTSNGTDIWTAGTTGTPGGVIYTTLGATTGTQLSTTVTNTRVVGIFGGQLYTSSMSGAFRGINTVGTGLPTTSGQTIALLPGFDPSTSAPESAYGYVFGDEVTLYVADDRATASGGGLQRWEFDGTTWTLAYTLSSGLTAGLRSVTISSEDGLPTIYCVTADAISAASGNKIVSVMDIGSGSAFTTIATAPGNEAYRGVDFAPTASNPPPPCYANCDGSTSVPFLNVNDFICFQSQFAAGTTYANCDGSTVVPVLNVNDFICFQSRFAAGCSAP